LVSSPKKFPFGIELFGKKNFYGNLSFPPKKHAISRMTLAKKNQKNMQSGVFYFVNRLSKFFSRFVPLGSTLGPTLPLGSYYSKFNLQLSQN
jgi:hypothetical protein